MRITIVRRSLAGLLLCLISPLANAAPKYDIVRLRPDFRVSRLSEDNVIIGTVTHGNGQTQACLAILEPYGDFRYEFIDEAGSEGIARNNRSASLVKEWRNGFEQYWIHEPHRALRITIPSAKIVGITDNLEIAGTIDDGFRLFAFRANRYDTETFPKARGLAIAGNGTVLLEMNDGGVRLWHRNGAFTDPIWRRYEHISANGRWLAGENQEGTRAVRWTSGGVAEISPLRGDKLTVASGINDNGDVAGTSGRSGPFYDIRNRTLKAILSTGGQVHNLNNLLTKQAKKMNLTLFAAGPITNRSYIIGYARDRAGNWVNVMLIPTY